MVRAMRALVGIRLDQGPFTQVHPFFFPEKFLRARHSILFAQRSPGRLLRHRVPNRMKRSVRLEHHRIFFRLRVAEVTHAPKRSGHLLVINFIDLRDAHALAQKLIGGGIRRIHQRRRVIVSLWVRPMLAQKDIRAPLR